MKFRLFGFLHWGILAPLNRIELICLRQSRWMIRCDYFHKPDELTGSLFVFFFSFSRCLLDSHRAYYSRTKIVLNFIWLKVASI